MVPRDGRGMVSTGGVKDRAKGSWDVRGDMGWSEICACGAAVGMGSV